MPKTHAPRAILARLTAASLLALPLSPLAAQSAAEFAPPAELPPETFEGPEYVDSLGCVYVRAGVDGSVVWVPRVTRTREPVCGLTPTDVTAAPAAVVPAPETETAVTLPETAAPETGPAEATSETETAATSETAPVSTTKPEARPERPVAEVAGAPAVDALDPDATPTSVTLGTDPAAGSETDVILVEPEIAEEPAETAPLPRAVTMTEPVRERSLYPEGAPSSRGYPGPGIKTRPVTLTPEQAARLNAGRQLPMGSAPLVGGNGYRFMADPAAPTAGSAPLVGGTGYRAVRRATPADAGTRVLPKHLFEDPSRDRSGLYVPEGYRKAWDDGRLNPRRAEQSVAGIVATRLVWTSTVPRRLVDQSGQDASARYPMLYYPFTDLAMQRRYEANPAAYEVRVSTKGTVRLVEKKATGTVSSRSAAPAKPAATGHRYVQIGTFGDAANIRKAIGSVQAMGLPAAQQKVTRKGQPMQVVLAGPFDGAADLNRALAKLKSAGYRDAFTR